MGVARKELIMAGISACRQRLEGLGFTRHEAEIFTLPLAPRILGWVGLGRGVHNGDGSMVVIPHIGLLHQDVERFVAACARLPYHRYSPATVQTGLGQLTLVRTAIRVSFRPEESVDAAAELISQPVEECGLAWMREYASLQGIQALDHHPRYQTTLSSWQRAVIAYMLGHPDLARQHLRDTITQIERAGRWNAAQLIEIQQRFAAALEERMALGPWHP
jgi:hypothetical protein